MVIVGISFTYRRNICQCKIYIFIKPVDTFGVWKFYECSYVVPIPGHFPPLQSIHGQRNDHSVECYIGIDQARRLKVLTTPMNFY